MHPDRVFLKEMQEEHETELMMDEDSDVVDLVLNCESVNSYHNIFNGDYVLESTMLETDPNFEFMFKVLDENENEVLNDNKIFTNSISSSDFEEDVS